MNCVLGATTPLLFTAGLALAGWISIWAIYAWAARDGSWVATYGVVTMVALALPVAFVGWYERWQVTHGFHNAAPDRRTKQLNWACGLFATVLGLLALPFIVLCALFAWGFWSDDARAASVYFALVALAMLAAPVAFMHYYDRWQKRNGLHNGKLDADNDHIAREKA